MRDAGVTAEEYALSEEEFLEGQSFLPEVLENEIFKRDCQLFKEYVLKLKDKIKSMFDEIIEAV